MFVYMRVYTHAKIKNVGVGLKQLRRTPPPPTLLNFAFCHATLLQRLSMRPIVKYPGFTIVFALIVCLVLNINVSNVRNLSWLVAIYIMI